VARAKTRFGLSDTTPVRRCYKAGREGFWLQRLLWTQDMTNSVVDSSSIAVNRRRRLAKSDALDARKLLTIA
jgi:transposase